MTEETRKRQPFRRLAADQRREEIINAAINLFGSRSEEEVSIDEIAAAAGTSRSSLYRHFEDKGELYLASMRTLSTELVARLDAVAFGGSPSQQLADRITVYFDFLEEYGVGYADLLQMSMHVPSQEAIKLASEVRDQVFQLTYETLEIAEPPAALRIGLQAWMAGLEWTAMEWLRDRREPRSQVEVLMQVQFASMLVGVAAYDPDVAIKLDWILEQEPPGSPAALFVRSLLDAVTLRMIGNCTRMLGPG
ncbi:TetR/AcrR family transcriptional regulator [Actinocorallia longicatena]